MLFYHFGLSFGHVLGRVVYFVAELKCSRDTSHFQWVRADLRKRPRHTTCTLARYLLTRQASCNYIFEPNHATTLTLGG